MLSRMHWSSTVAHGARRLAAHRHRARPLQSCGRLSHIALGYGVAWVAPAYRSPIARDRFSLPARLRNTAPACCSRSGRGSRPSCYSLARRGTRVGPRWRLIILLTPLLRGSPSLAFGAWVRYWRSMPACVGAPSDRCLFLGRDRRRGPARQFACALVAGAPERAACRWPAVALRVHAHGRPSCRLTRALGVECRQGAADTSLERIAESLLVGQPRAVIDQCAERGDRRLLSVRPSAPGAADPTAYAGAFVRGGAGQRDHRGRANYPGTLDRSAGGAVPR